MNWLDSIRFRLAVWVLGKNLWMVYQKNTGHYDYFKTEKVKP